MCRCAQPSRTNLVMSLHGLWRTARGHVPHRLPLAPAGRTTGCSPPPTHTSPGSCGPPPATRGRPRPATLRLTGASEAHYAGAVPLDLLKEKQDRIATAIKNIDQQTLASTSHFDTIEANLRLALDLAEACGTAYTTAPDHIKKLFNQAFFVRILVNPDASVRPELAPPFNHLLGPGAVATPKQTKRSVPKNGPIALGSQVEEASKGIPLVPSLT